MKAFRRQKPDRFGLEALEQRILLSSDPIGTLTGGILTGVLTANSDTVSVSMVDVSDDGGLIISLTVNGTTEIFGDTTDGVHSIALDGLEGDDEFTVVDSLIIPLAITGGDDTDTLIGPDLDTEWTLDGADSGSAEGITSFAEVENLVGGTGSDRFILRTTGSVSGEIDGGDGDDTLIGPNADNTWVLSGPDSGTLNGSSAFTNIENLTGGNAADVFQIGTSGSLSGLLDGGLVNANSPADDTLDFSSRSTAVSVDLALGSATSINEFSRINTLIGSADSGDMLSGPGESGDQVNWEITDEDSGEVEGTFFSSFENLSGRGATSDAFYFDQFGFLNGTVSGGTGIGTTDGFSVFKNSTEDTVFLPSSIDASGTVVFLLEGKTIDYAGMDKSDPVTGDDADRVISGSVFNDAIVLADADMATTGQMKVTFEGLNFFDGIGYDNSFTFANPTTSLTIKAGSGGDKITVESIDDLFAADLLIYGNNPGDPTILPDAAADEVRFEGDTKTRGGYLEVFADKIFIDPYVTVSTLADETDLATGNDIVFRARRIGTPEIENLLPSGYLAKKVEIDVGHDVTILASSIYLIAQAEDRSLQDTLGLTTLESNFFLDPALEFLNDLTSLPIKVLVKASEAKVTIGEDATLLADDVVGIYATAGSDASAQAKSQLFSIGYSQSDAKATIEILDGVVIEGGGPVNITSDASATASMSTETSREESGSVPGNSSSQFAASIAVSWANLVSKTTVAETASVHGGRTVNIRALGTTESEADAESGLFADGTAALALALQFSTADILTQIDGTVTADMNTNGGEVVKFEFDPTVAAADYTSSQGTIPRLKTGDTVQVTEEVPVSPSDPDDWSDLLMPANTVFRYIGPDNLTPQNLLTQSYRDPDLWEVTSEPWGYVDTFNNRISVFNTDNEANNWVVVTEDTADYSKRRGASIVGLPDGETYYIIGLEDDPTTAVDESHYIQLALTERNAINGIAINLEDGATTNNRTFDASNIDGDTITLPGVGDTFELGQAVIYREPGRFDADRVVELPDGSKIWQSPNTSIDGDPYVPLIDGLEHGSTYYVMTGVDQFNLIGDQRLVNEQKLQLGALENETRGGIARKKLGDVSPGATGFSLSATQILDSTFLTFGAVSQLDATDSASATAGLSSEDPDDPNDDDDGGWDWDSSAFDNIFNKASEKYGQNSNAGGANGQASIQIGGALAFSYTDHKTKTLIGGNADLNSNDDMEITSNIVEHLQLNAESSTEEQQDADGNSTGTSAANSLSAAIIVGIESNTAQVIIESGAEMDAMRAMRLISGVTYPFLTRPDEYVPTSIGSLSDKITTEGFDAVNTYLDGTLGLKSSLLNTWAKSTASASGVGIAGSINVLIFNNVAESIVHSGVKINQDPFYRPSEDYFTNPDHDPTIDNVDTAHSANANNVDEHVVSIEATNYMQFLNVTGVFDFALPSAELSARGFEWDPLESTCRHASLSIL